MGYQLVRITYCTWNMSWVCISRDEISFNFHSLFS